MNARPREIVEDVDSLVLSQVVLGEIGSNKSCPAGY
jgi:hypothetical protein